MISHDLVRGKRMRQWQEWHSSETKTLDTWQKWKRAWYLSFCVRMKPFSNRKSYYVIFRYLNLNLAIRGQNLEPPLLSQEDLVLHIRLGRIISFPSFSAKNDLEILLKRENLRKCTLPIWTNGHHPISLFDRSSESQQEISIFFEPKVFNSLHSENFDPCGPILIKVMLLFARENTEMPKTRPMKSISPLPRQIVKTLIKFHQKAGSEDIGQQRSEK